MKIVPIREVGSGRTGTLTTSYKNIVEKIGKPNVTDMDDPDKVKASWGFKDEETGAEGFIWCYKYYGKPESCKSWSTDGDATLLKTLFGDAFETN